jgi:hypothetical protein
MRYTSNNLYGAITCWCLAAWLAGGSLDAATFSVSPAGVAAGSSDAFTLSVSGLANGQRILVEEFRDINGNGVADPGEDLVLSFKVSDGELPPFAPVPGLANPGDDDASTNAHITKVFTLSVLPETIQAVGGYVFKVSALDGSFAPLTQPFAVLAGTDPQAVVGRVLAGGTPVSAAVVVLLSASGEDSGIVTAGLSDAAGNFSLKAPPNSYLVLALKAGYVADIGNAPAVALAAGIDSTQNVALVAGAASVSGRVTDAITSNGIPALQLFLESPDGLLASTISDADGNFSAAVTPGIWKLKISDLAAALLGYGKKSTTVNTTGGSVAGLQIPLSGSKGSLELVFFFPSGSFGGSTNGSISFPTRLQNYYALYNLSDANFPTNALFSGPAGSGLTNTPSAVFGANYQGGSAFYSSPQISVPPYPPGGLYQVNYKGQPQPFVLANPDAQNRQLVLVPNAIVDAAGQLTEVRWSYRDVNGNPIACPPFVTALEIRIDGIIGGRLHNGSPLPGETNHVLSSTVFWTNVSSIQMVYNDTLENQYVMFYDLQEQPLQNVSGPPPVANVGAPYHFLPVAAGGGSPYSWSLPAGNLPPGLFFTAITGEIYGTPTGPGTFPVTIRLTDSHSQIVNTPTVLTVVGSPTLRLELRPVLSPGQFGFRFSGEVGRSYSLEYSTTLTNWFTLLTTNGTGAPLELLDSTATNQFRYYRVRLNP